MQCVNCKFGISCWYFPWTQPCSLLGDIPCNFMTWHPGPPLYSNHPTRLPIDWAWAEDSKNVFNISWKWPTNILKTLSQFSDPPAPPPTQPPQIRLIYIPIDSSRRQDSEYIIYISIDTWRQESYDTWSLLRKEWKIINYAVKWKTTPHITVLHPATKAIMECFGRMLARFLHDINRRGERRTNLVLLCTSAGI